MRLPVLSALSPVQTCLAVAATAAGVLLISSLARDPALVAWIALGLGAASLVIAVLLVRKVRMFDFKPEVLAGDLILPRASRARSPKLLVPLQFSNAGGGDGVIQWVALRLTIDGKSDSSVLLSPVAEVDMQGFLQAKRQITPDNAVDPFSAFVLEGRRVVAKFVLFDVSERGRSAPLELRPGRYSFEVFLKTSASPQPRMERRFEHVVTEKHIEEYRSDATVYLINYNITLPAMRRELSSGEWLPRAREA
jgi:hypothetical protein